MFLFCFRKPLVHSNPYMDHEKTKTNDLLKSLHKDRIETALMSPFISRLKNLCDSDSDSSVEEKNTETARKKLSFNEFSDKENEKDEFTFDEDNLEDRIKKKLNKKFVPVEARSLKQLDFCNSEINDCREVEERKKKDDVEKPNKKKLQRKGKKLH